MLLMTVMWGIAAGSTGAVASPDDLAMPGLILREPPDALPTEAEPEPTIAGIRAYLVAGEHHLALRMARRFVSGSDPGRPRDAVHMAIGMIHRQSGRHNLSRDAFAAVREANGPLGPWGAYYEAEQDMRRGRIDDAARECATYRARWPKGEHAGDCLRLIAQAQAAMNQASAARRTAAQYDDDHPLGPISEQITLTLARHAIADGQTAEAIATLQQLALDHAAPLTGRVAEEMLAELAAAGRADAVIPQSQDAMVQRALSLRDARRRDEAWSQFSELVQRANDVPDLARFVEDEAERFGWRTHRWDFLEAWHADRYEATDDPAEAWSRYRVLIRGGAHEVAATYALQMQQTHGSARSWRTSAEEVGKTLMLAGRYVDARKQFDQVTSGGGWTGRRGRFFAAFATLMAGEVQEAVARFSATIALDQSWIVESRYWRSRAYDLLERPADAEADRQWVLAEDPHSWYAVLIRQGEASAASFAAPRSGSWVGTPPPAASPEPTPRIRTPEPPPRIPVARPLRRRGAEARPGGLATLTWPWGDRSVLPTPPVAAPDDAPDEHPPPPYADGGLWQTEAGLQTLAAFSKRWGKHWPQLRGIEDLATIGLYDLSGPLMCEWYEAWRRDYRRRRRPARYIRSMKTADWRTLFIAAQDHHHASRFSNGLWDDVAPELASEAQRLAYPLAHGQVVWAASRDHGIDPFLVLGLMRQESNYKATAISRVGARGAMQIMPRTGHLLADLTHETTFTAGDLEDPILSVQYGITYLGLLMERFDGAFPLAVASYNGGPFNVSAWLAGTGMDLPMDAFVEHIPFRETRDYVKRVSAGYSTYVALYGPSGAQVVVPPRPTFDDPTVVDF